MAIPVVKIVTDPNKTEYAEFYIDGFRVNGVRAYEVQGEVGSIPRVVLTIVCKVETETFVPPNKEGE